MLTSFPPKISQVLVNLPPGRCVSIMSSEMTNHCLSNGLPMCYMTDVRILTAAFQVLTGFNGGALTFST